MQAVMKEGVYSFWCQPRYFTYAERIDMGYRKIWICSNILVAGSDRFGRGSQVDYIDSYLYTLNRPNLIGRHSEFQFIY